MLFLFFVCFVFYQSAASVLKMPDCCFWVFLFFLPQLIVVTSVSVQMDLAGQYEVQVVGHIPSGSVQLCQCSLFLPSFRCSSFNGLHFSLAACLWVQHYMHFKIFIFYPGLQRNSLCVMNYQNKQTR